MTQLEVLQTMEDKTFYSDSFGEEEVTVMRGHNIYYTLGKKSNAMIGIVPQEVKYLFQDYKKYYLK
tara:strand:- start:97 stop:294 length:198 start_codon:yes stop_codon:yes gene_type:complete